ncbi:hypothetical protein LIER_13534 [Lithospermum erythrorhizon]|uniref:Uncharacterized protein n=1 Tax=Lithospermum erythrorhizon TaxID=34254 RepID=A0AAV3PW82_LITER
MYQVGGNTGFDISGSKGAHEDDAGDSNSVGSISHPMGKDANDSTYEEIMFRHRFRMHKHVFFRIVEELSNNDNYFKQRFDAAKKEGYLH